MTGASYTVTCRGEARSGNDAPRQHLAECFGIPSAEVDPLLRGSTVFRCGPLPREPAEQLYRRLDSSGVVAYFDSGDPSDVDVTAAANTCGSCGTTRLRQGSCAWCGYGIEADAAAGATVSGIDTRDAEGARRALRLGIGAVLALLCLDQIMGMINTYRAGLRLGTFMELAPIVTVAMVGLLTYATWRYARARARPGWAGLLGATGPFGFGVLMLWDSRDETIAHGRMRLSQPLILGLSSLVIGGYWLFGIIYQEGQLSAVGRETQELKAAMPTATLESPTLTDIRLDAMRQRVDTYVRDAIKTVTGAGLTPSRAEEAVDRALAVYVRQIMWHNRTLVSRHSLDNPISGDRVEAIRSRREDRLDAFDKLLDSQSPGWPVLHAYRHWRHLPYRNDQPELAQAHDDLNQALVDFNQSVRWEMNKPRALEQHVRDAMERVFGNLDRYTARYDNRRIQITIREGPPQLKGRSVVYGWLAQTHTDPRGGETTLNWKMLRIGGDLSDQYLPGSYRAMPELRFVGRPSADG